MNHQRLQSYAAIAEVFGALAIVVSLIYAGYEFRRSNRMSSLEVDVILYEREREHNAVLFENREMAQLVIMADEAADELTGPDRLRYLEYQHDSPTVGKSPSRITETGSSMTNPGKAGTSGTSARCRADLGSRGRRTDTTSRRGPS